jgi:hypothetical protein
MRILVCGGRDFSDGAALWRMLDVMHANNPVTAIIHGAARGADRTAGNWARKNGVEEIACPADWTAYGRAAGPIRNAAMLADHKPDVVLAFPGGAGTADMVRQARRAGVRVVKAVP